MNPQWQLKNLINDLYGRTTGDLYHSYQNLYRYLEKSDRSLLMNHSDHLRSNTLDSHKRVVLARINKILGQEGSQERLLYERAALEGNPEAIYQLATLDETLNSENSGAESIDSVLTLFRRGAEMGYPPALNKWGITQILHLGDYREGLRNLEAAAAEGYPEALYHLSKIYQNGVLGIKDPVRALQYLKEAAALEHPRAILGLAQHYHREGNQELALRILNKDSIPGTFYYRGLLHEKSQPKTAMEYYRQGMERGDRNSTLRFSSLSLQKPSNSNAERLSIENLERLSNEYPIANYHLGKYYLSKKETREAENYFRKGAQLGDGYCALQLAELASEAGDNRGSRYWYEIASKSSDPKVRKEVINFYQSKLMFSDSLDLATRSLDNPEFRDVVIDILKRCPVETLVDFLAHQRSRINQLEKENRQLSSLPGSRNFLESQKHFESLQESFV